MEQALVAVSLCVATLVTCVGLLMLEPDAAASNPTLSARPGAGIYYDMQKPGSENRRANAIIDAE